MRWRGGKRKNYSTFVKIMDDRSIYFVECSKQLWRKEALKMRSLHITPQFFHGGNNEIGEKFYKLMLSKALPFSSGKIDSREFRDLSPRVPIFIQVLQMFNNDFSRRTAELQKNQLRKFPDAKAVSCGNNMNSETNQIVIEEREFPTSRIFRSSELRRTMFLLLRLACPYFNHEIVRNLCPAELDPISSRGIQIIRILMTIVNEGINEAKIRAQLKIRGGNSADDFQPEHQWFLGTYQLRQTVYPLLRIGFPHIKVETIIETIIENYCPETLSSQCKVCHLCHMKRLAQVLEIVTNLLAVAYKEQNRAGSLIFQN